MILNYIDRKFSYDAQKRFTIIMPIGAILGYLLSECVTLLIFGWQKYHFIGRDTFIMIFIWLFVLIPFIINRFKYNAKYKKILKKVKNNQNSDLISKVKAKFDYQSFKKGEVYTIIESDLHHIDGSLFINNDEGLFHFKRIINKFEFDDIKEERLKKLKKLKRLY